MKSNLLVALAIFAGCTAQADYKCTDFKNDVSLTVNENHFTQYGDTSITLVSEAQTTKLFGTVHSESGLLLNKKVVNLYPFQGDQLTIVSRPRFCGRGSCEPDAQPLLTASLKIGETQTDFTCHLIGNETNP